MTPALAAARNRCSARWRAIQDLRERSTHIRVSGGRALNPGWHTVRDVTNMLVISEAIVRSAIERRESRGSQWRFDHLDQEVAFGKINFVTRRGADAMEVVSVPLDPASRSAPAAPRAQPLLRCGQAAQGIPHREQPPPTHPAAPAVAPKRKKK